MPKQVITVNLSAQGASDLLAVIEQEGLALEPAESMAFDAITSAITAAGWERTRYSGTLKPATERNR